MVHLIYCSLFSMDGDFEPMVDLAKLREKHGFLLVIDDVRPLIGLFRQTFFFLFLTTVMCCYIYGSDPGLRLRPKNGLK